MYIILPCKPNTHLIPLGSKIGLTMAFAWEMNLARSFLIRKLSGGVVDVETDGAGRSLPAAVEVALAVLVEEDID